MRYLLLRADFCEDSGGYYYDHEGFTSASSTISTRVASDFNYGVYCPNAGDRITFESTWDHLRCIYHPFTIAVRFKTTPTTEYKALCARGLRDSTGSFWFGIVESDHADPAKQNRLYFRSRTSSNEVDELYSVTAVTDNSWHWVIFTRDGTEWKIYIDDSTPDATATVNYEEIYDSAANYFSIASARGASTQDPLDTGIVDDVILAAKAWTSQEIDNFLNYDDIEAPPASQTHGWRFEERGPATLKARDRIGGAHGDPDGNGAETDAGRFYWGRKWTSTTQRLTCGNPTDLQITTGPLGVGLWFKCTATNTADRYLFSKIASGQIGYGLRIEASTDGVNPNGLTLVTSSNGTAETLVQGTTNVCDSTWHYVAIGRSGTTGNIFLDGQSEATGSVPATIHNSTADFVFGNTDDYNAGAIDCMLNWPETHNVALDVTNAYNLWKHTRLNIPQYIPAHQWTFVCEESANQIDTGYSLDKAHSTNANAIEDLNYPGAALGGSYGFLCGESTAARVPVGQHPWLPPSGTEKFSMIWGGWFGNTGSTYDLILLGSYGVYTGGNHGVALCLGAGPSAGGEIEVAVSSDGSVLQKRIVTKRVFSGDEVEWRYRYHQIVLTRDGTTYKTYIDGNLIDTWTTGPSSIHRSTNNFVIGNNDSNNGGMNQGYTDYAQFFVDRILTDDEISYFWYGPEEIIVSRLEVSRERPYPGQKNIFENTTVSFRIEDVLQTSGVNSSSLEVKFNGVSVVSGGSFQTGYDGTIDAYGGYGYDVEIDPDEFFDYCIYIRVTVDAEDNEGTAMPTHTWFFRIRCIEVGKSFLLNSGLGSINSVSSLFKEKISNITAGSKGNISLNVTADPIPTTVKNYELRVVKAGRLDKEIDTVEEVTKDLGSGQISYSEAKAFRGNFYPPHFVIDENTGTYPVFGYERTLSKFVGGGDSGSRVYHTYLCDRNDESFFIFFIDSGSSTATYVSSHPKLGKTDTSPLNKVTISSFRVYSAVRITNNNYIIFSLDGFSASDDEFVLKSKIINDSGTVVEDLDNFVLVVKDPLSVNPLITSLDIYSDMTGNLYGVITYSLNIPLLREYEIRFFRSYNNGRSWELVKEPGTDSLIDIGDPLEEIQFYPYDSNAGSGYRGARLYWDDINEEFILTIAGVTTTSYYTRYVTMFSKDFKIWNRMNFPIFKSNVAETFNSDLVSNLPSTFEGISNLCSRFIRLGDKLFSIGVEYNEQQYTCIFPNEDELYGSRLGYFWSGDNATAPDKGVQIRQFDLKKIDDVAYLSTCHYDNSNVTGYVVNAIGTLTNLPDQGIYNGAWFGHMSLPNNNHGWTRTATGSPTETVANTGLTITGSSGNYVDYSRNKIAAATGTTVVKFSIKPVTDSGPSSPTAQGIRVVLDGTTTQVDFTIRVSTTGLYFIDNNGAFNTTTAMSITDYIDILIAYNGDKTRIYYKTSIEYEDRWQLFVERAGLVNSAGTESYKFGILSDPGAATSAIWRYLYYRDNYNYSDINADIRLQANIISFSASDYDDELDSIPMNISEKSQLIIDDLVLLWRGMDSFEDDSWTFTIDSDFGAENVFMKSPKIIYRTANTSSDQYFVLDADDDDLSSYLFDVYIFLNTNFRYVKVQANDTDSWGTPSFSSQLDNTYDTGTIAADSTRVNDDLLTVRMTGKNYLHGELKDKYIMLEKILEPGTPSDNTYGNVAFRILENGPDYVVISTKGLIEDEAAGGGTYQDMKVVSGDDFVIYDTRISDYETTLQNYRFIRVLIEASDGYGDTWTSTNQPNLPNERSWQIGEFDIGIRVYLTEDVSYPYNEDEDANVASQENEYGQIDFTKHGEKIHSFSLTYKVASEEDYRQILALYNTANESAEPFWYIPNIANHPEKVYLVTLSGNLKSDRILPDYQTIKMDMDEVK